MSEYQDVFIDIGESYEPATVVLQKGKPAKLRIYRDAHSRGGEELRIPRFKVKRTLPPGKITTIDLQPDELGAFAIESGDGTLRGTLLVV